METRVQKWGHSLGLRIPKPFAAVVGIQQNTSVDIVVEDGKLVVTPIIEAEYSLEEMLAQVNETNVHEEMGNDPSAGKEAW